MLSEVSTVVASPRIWLPLLVRTGTHGLTLDPKSRPSELYAIGLSLWVSLRSRTGAGCQCHSQPTPLHPAVLLLSAGNYLAANRG